MGARSLLAARDTRIKGETPQVPGDSIWPERFQAGEQLIGRLEQVCARLAGFWALWGAGAAGAKGEKKE